MSPPDSPATAALLAESAWLHRLALRLVSEPGRADDAVQETLVRALRHPPAARKPLRVWLATVLRNVVRSEHRSAERRATRERERAPGLEGEPADELAQRLELHRSLLDAVQRLDEPYRTTVALRFLQELPVRAVAEHLGVPEKTVYTRIERALAALRESLDRRHGRRDAWVALVLSPSGPPVGVGPGGIPPAAGPVPLAPLLAMSSLGKWTLACAAVALLGFLATRSRGPVPRGLGEEPALVHAPPPGESVPRKESSEEPRTQREALPARESGAEPARSRPEPAAAPLLTGFVRDLARRPVAGLEVGYERAAPEPGPTLVPAPAPTALGLEFAGASAARSDAAGRFELPRPDGPCRLLARGLGFATILAPALTGAPPMEPPVVFVGPERHYGGTVVDAEGAPLSEIELDVQLSGALARELVPGAFGNALPLARVRSDARGRFAFPGLGWAPEMRLVARSTGRGEATLALPETSDDELVVVLTGSERESRALAGHVLFSDGRPAPDARVSAGGIAVLTDAEGAFELLPDEAGAAPRRLVAVALGRQPAVLELAGLEAARRHDLELVLGAEALRLGGRVVDAAGDPVEGATVWTDEGEPFGEVLTRMGGLDFLMSFDLEGVIAGTRDGWRTASTDGEGRFELSGLLDRSYVLRVLDGRTRELAGPFDARAGDDSLRLVLPGEATRRVAGRVLSRSGAPIAGARIAVERRGRAGDERRRSQRPDPDRFLLTDDEGRFEFPALCTEGTRLLVGAPGASEDSALELAREPDLEHLELTLALVCHVRFRLDDPDFADRLTLRNERDEAMQVGFQLGSVLVTSQGVFLEDGVTDILTVDEGARSVVLTKNDEEVARVPLRLTPGELEEIRL